jgi:hypothetical protein
VRFCKIVQRIDFLFYMEDIWLNIMYLVADIYIKLGAERYLQNTPQ